MSGIPSTVPRRPAFALFAYGFRPFFLLSGWYAVAGIAVWLLLVRSGASPLAAMPPQFWHGHEMLFGFVGATIAGFMLTAVPSWTGSRGFAGIPLMALTATWILGRLAFAMADRIPVALLTLAELSFLPGLLLLIAPPLLRTLNRNSPLLLVLAAFWLLDAAFMWAVLNEDAGLARQVLLVALDIVLLMITVIGGRVVPAFTANALKARGLVASPVARRGVERLAIGSMAAIAAADLSGIPEHFTAPIAGVAALAHFVRAAGWKTRYTLRDPIVWVLHAAYLWLPVGLALRALHATGGSELTTHWLHALGTGAAATMILAVMTRAALGHTGRALRVAQPIVWSYGLLILAALIRVFGPAVLPLAYMSTITLASACWIASFLLFVLVYTPILLRPRADGRPG